MSAQPVTFKRSNPNALSVYLAGKLAAFILALTLAMVFLVVVMGQAFAGPMPKAQVMVKGTDIKLGDVFEGLSQHADFVLAPAPHPGEELVWHAPTLLRIATAFNLPWRPQDEDKISIRRAASIVDADTVRAVIRDHLATMNDADSFNVTLSTTIPEIVVPGLDMPRVEVADFSMPQSGGPFSAIIRVAASGGKPETVTLRGMAERLVHVPVLKRTMKNGTIIEATDITWVTKPAAGIRRDIILDEASLIGTTPRKAVAAGIVLRPDDLQTPLMIKRGAPVTMVYETGGMYITAKGRAMEDGAYGQTIKVSNVGSNKQLEAQVTGSRIVTVR
ncbi:MAG: flagella basal body P-ring formation protein FlgA [Proteobacteria bacterium]|nr:flagella basal body P-ring formation protein FlgA [Pseudomonadota bacterium]